MTYSLHTLARSFIKNKDLLQMQSLTRCFSSQHSSNHSVSSLPVPVLVGHVGVFKETGLHLYGICVWESYLLFLSELNFTPSTSPSFSSVGLWGSERGNAVFRVSTMAFTTIYTQNIGGLHYKCFPQWPPLTIVQPVRWESRIVQKYQKHWRKILYHLILNALLIFGHFLAVNQPSKTLNAAWNLHCMEDDKGQMWQINFIWGYILFKWH